MQKIKAVIFDFGGVLVDDKFQDYISQHIAPYKSIEQEISDMEYAVNKGDLPVKIYDDFLAVMTGRKPSDIDHEILASYILHKEVFAIVTSFRKQHIATAILSNFPNEWFAQLREKFHLDNFFDAIFVSSQLHSVKPQQEFFRSALEQLHVLPNETVFIDDRDVYTQAAEKFGINGIVFTSVEKLKKDLLTVGLHV